MGTVRAVTNVSHKSRFSVREQANAARFILAKSRLRIFAITGRGQSEAAREHDRLHMLADYRCRYVHELAPFVPTITACPLFLERAQTNAEHRGYRPASQRGRGIGLAMLTLVSFAVSADQVYDPSINQYSCNTSYNGPRPPLGFHETGYGYLSATPGIFFVERSSAPPGGALGPEGQELLNSGWTIVNNCVRPRWYWDQFLNSGYFPSIYFKGSPASSPKNLGQTCSLVKGQFNSGSGNVYQATEDSTASGQMESFTRYYNSELSVHPAMGFQYGWTHTYSRKLIDRRSVGMSGVSVSRPDGKSIYFSNAGGIWIADADVHATLVEVTSSGEPGASAWEFQDRDGTRERFNATGILQTITDVKGSSQTLSYDEFDRLYRVDANDGTYRTFAYDDNDAIVSITDQAGRQWRYRYDAAGNLAYADNPDGTTVQYHYEASNLSHALTGITDERGVRVKTIEYYSDGRVKAIQHTGAGPRYAVAYNESAESIDVADSRGNTRTYRTQLHLGRALISEISGFGCTGC